MSQMRPLSSITFPSATVGYTYGVGGCVSCGGAKLPDSITRTQTATGSAETLNYTYDGSLLLSESWSGTIAGKVSVTYDNDFRLVSQSVNGANPVTLGYDADGLLTSVGSLTLTRSATNGFLTGTTLGAVSDNIIYSNYGETTSYNATASGASMFDVKYTRDVLGRIAQKVETINGTATTYDYIYDVTGRLTDVNKNGVNISHYIYDSNGNRVTATINGVTSQGFYDLQDRMTKYGNAIYTYTANGELATKTDTVTGNATSYNYDAFGNLLNVTLPNGTLIEYIIDGNNRRIGKKVNGVLVYGLLYKDNLNPVAELDGAGNVISRFVYGSKFNVPDFMIKGGVTYRIISDHLGSPRLVVDTATGSVIQQMDYDEFGNVISDTNPGFQPFGFAGGLYGVDTGLVRFGLRDYNPKTGRWTSKDPIRFGGGVNLYGYVMNDPVNWVDSYGLWLQNNSDKPIVFKPEHDVPKLLPPGKTYPNAIDGVKPPDWNGDWLKVVDDTDVEIQKNGNPLLSGKNSGVPLVPDLGPLTDHFPGRKKEPECTKRHKDWKYDPNNIPTYHKPDDC